MKINTTNSTTIFQETLAYRNADANRSVKTDKDASTSRRYADLKKDSKRWTHEVQMRKEWAKRGETIYTLPLNTANEAKLIYYIDQLPSVKPYISELIRKDMENPSIKFTKSWRRSYNNNVGTKRMFSLKFSNYNDTDILDHLKSITDQHVSKRAYIIALLEKDIIDTGFQFPKELAQYSKANKVIKNKLADEFYRQIYYYIETAIKNGSTTIRNRDARKFINGRMVISSHTLSTYWLRYFVETGALKLQEGSTVVYDINVDKFNELVNPNDIIL